MISRIFGYIFLAGITALGITYESVRNIPLPDVQPDKTPEVKHARTYIVSDIPPGGPRMARPIFFLNENVGWESCLGRVCHTEDGGMTWKVISEKNLENLGRLLFVNENAGWGISNELNTKRRREVVIKTDDGGKTWKEVLEVDSPIHSISFLNEKVGVVSARWTGLYTTKDGGKKWKEVSKEAKDEFLQGFVSEGLNNVALIDEKRALGWGDGIWQSVDMGISWENIVSPDEVPIKLLASSFIDEKTGFIVGYESQVWKTVDGKSWKKLEIPGQYIENNKKDFTVYQVSFINADEGWISCHKTFSRDTDKLLHTTDGGKTWELVYDSRESLDEIKFVDPQRGFAINWLDGKLLQTNDGGRSWLPQQISAN